MAHESNAAKIREQLKALDDGQGDPFMEIELSNSAAFRNEEGEEWEIEENPDEYVNAPPDQVIDA